MLAGHWHDCTIEGVFKSLHSTHYLTCNAPNEILLMLFFTRNNIRKFHKLRSGHSSSHRGYQRLKMAEPLAYVLITVLAVFYSTITMFCLISMIRMIRLRCANCAEVSDSNSDHLMEMQQFRCEEARALRSAQEF